MNQFLLNDWVGHQKYFFGYLSTYLTANATERILIPVKYSHKYEMEYDKFDGWYKRHQHLQGGSIGLSFITLPHKCRKVSL